jgi:hypothetical protein
MKLLDNQMVVDTRSLLDGTDKQFFGVHRFGDALHFDKPGDGPACLAPSRFFDGSHTVSCSIANVRQSAAEGQTDKHKHGRKDQEHGYSDSVVGN